MSDILEQWRSAKERWIISGEANEMIVGLETEIERLRDEVDRFRRALTAISCQDADYKDEGVIWCASRARAALGEGKE